MVCPSSVKLLDISVGHSLSKTNTVLAPGHPVIKADISPNSWWVMKGADLSVVLLLTWEDAGFSRLAMFQGSFWWRMPATLHSTLGQSLWNGRWWFTFGGWENRKCFLSQLWCRGHRLSQQKCCFIPGKAVYWQGKLIFILSKWELMHRVCAQK